MKKFIVTGSMRSGTTFIASVLNSQPMTLCVEDYPWSSFPKNFKTQEEFLRFSTELDSKFIYLGLPEPRLAENATLDDDLVDLYISHLKKVFQCEYIGFKRTMMPKSEMIERIKEGYKIIIVKRDVEKILKSWVNRVHTDIHDAAERLQHFLKEINYYHPEITSDQYIVIDFDTMLANIDQTLLSLSEFLGIKIENPTMRYHSFNKNRAIFDQNSSFVKDYSDSLMLTSLPRKYTPEIFKMLAALVESGKYKPRLKQKVRRFMKYIYEISSQRFLR